MQKNIFPRLTLSAIVCAGSFFVSCDNVNCIADPHFADDGTPLDSTAVLFTPRPPEAVKLYVETSGSMNGFFRANKANRFKSTVWSVFSRLDPLAGGRVSTLSNGGDINAPMPLGDYRDRMNAGAFVSNSSTRVPDMLRNIVGDIDVARGETAVLVSDMKYSPVGKTLAPELVQYQEDIRAVVSAVPGISLAFVCATSEFLSAGGGIAEDHSPYYFVILGAPEHVASLRNDIARWCEAGGSYVESGDMCMDYRTPPHAIGHVENGLLHGTYANVITAFDRNMSDTCSFVVRVDMTGYPRHAFDAAVLGECFKAKAVYGSGIGVELLEGDGHVMDGQAYEEGFRRVAHADFRVKLFDMPLEAEVVEWTFSSEPFDRGYNADFRSMIVAEKEGDLAGSFSFDKFLEGCFNARPNTSAGEPVRVLVSSVSE